MDIRAESEPRDQYSMENVISPNLFSSTYIHMNIVSKDQEEVQVPAAGNVFPSLLSWL